MCVLITDSLRNRAEGEFGGPNNYLKFQFEGKKLLIALAPFDKGTSHRVFYNKDYFEILNPNFQQKKYRFKLLVDEVLYLETINSRKQVITYKFVNASRYLKDIDQVRNVREYEGLIFEINYMKEASGYYLSTYYLIDNSVLNLLPSPTFSDKLYFSLGSYLEANLRIPWEHLKTLGGKEAAFEFDVVEKGIENIAIVKKLGDEIDFQFFDLLKGTSKKWEPLMVSGKPVDTRVRLTISFQFKEK
jgi:hypothetical protein